MKIEGEKRENKEEKRRGEEEKNNVTKDSPRGDVIAVLKSFSDPCRKSVRNLAKVLVLPIFDSAACIGSRPDIKLVLAFKLGHDNVVYRPRNVI